MKQSKSQQALGEVLDHEEAAGDDAGEASEANVEQQLHGSPLRSLGPRLLLDLMQRRPRAALLFLCNDSKNAVAASSGDLSMHIIISTYLGTCSLSAEEHTARVKAEAAGEHAVRRLTVAQEQLVEYAQQQAADTVSVLEEAQALQTLLASIVATSNSGRQPTASSSQPADDKVDAARNGTSDSATVATGESPAASMDIGQLTVRMQELRKRLLAMASEADNFAAQQKADLARSKRSLSQVRMPTAHALRGLHPRLATVTCDTCTFNNTLPKTVL